MSAAATLVPVGVGTRACIDLADLQVIAHRKLAERSDGREGAKPLVLGVVRVKRLLFISSPSTRAPTGVVGKLERSQNLTNQTSVETTFEAADGLRVGASW